MDAAIIDSYRNVRLLVAGEVGIDEYLWGSAHRISPEAPVPVVEVEKTEQRLGLSGNVAENIVSLGAKVTFVSVKGLDSDAERLESLLDRSGVSERIMLTDESRPTLRKVRLLAHNQHVARIDYERVHSLDERMARQFCERICDELPKVDGVILQDYGKGLWNTDTVKFIERARELGKPVFVDPNRNSPLGLYRGSTLLTPNTTEAAILAGMSHLLARKGVTGNDEALSEMGAKLLHETGAENVVITCGEAGMVSLVKGEKGLSRIPTYARDVFDVTGAGDTVVSVLALTMVLGHPLARCMRVANAAAGIVVGRIGASSVTPDELKAELERLGTSGNL